MKTALIAVLALGLGGCANISKIHVPPGSLASWDHIGNYGPAQTGWSMKNVVKLPDGTFILGNYEGKAQWLGFGPHDIIVGLHIDGNGNPAGPVTAVQPAPAPAAK